MPRIVDGVVKITQEDLDGVNLLLAQSPNDTVLHMQKFRVLDSLEMKAAAANTLQEAIKVSKKDSFISQDTRDLLLNTIISYSSVVGKESVKLIQDFGEGFNKVLAAKELLTKGMRNYYSPFAQELAVNFFDESLKYDPNNPMTHILKASFLSDKGRYAEAVTSSEKALTILTPLIEKAKLAGDMELQKTHESLLNGTQEIHLKAIRKIKPALTKSSRDLEKEIKTEKVDTTEKTSLSSQDISKQVLELWRSRKHPEALALANQAINLYPKSPDLHAIKSLALNSLGRFEEANSSYQTAKDFGTSKDFLKLVNDHMQYSLDKRSKGEVNSSILADIKQQQENLKLRVDALEDLTIRPGISLDKQERTVSRKTGVSADNYRKATTSETIPPALKNPHMLEKLTTEALSKSSDLWRGDIEEIRANQQTLDTLKAEYESLGQSLQKDSKVKKSDREKVQQQIAILDHAIAEGAQNLKDTENLHKGAELKREGRILVRENEFPHPPAYLDRMKPESVALGSPEYLAFINGDPQILRKLMMFRTTKWDAMRLGGSDDYNNIHILAKELKYDQTSIPLPSNNLYREGNRTDVKLDRRLKKEISPGVYKDILDYETKLHTVSIVSHEAAVKQYQDYRKELQKNPPKKLEDIESTLSTVVNQRNQYISIQKIPGDRSVIARKGVQELTQEIETVLNLKEAQLLKSTKSQKEKMKHSFEIAKEKLAYSEGLLKEQIELLDSQTIARNDDIKYSNPLTRYLQSSKQTITSLKAVDKALITDKTTKQTTENSTAQVKQLTERVYAEQDKLQAAVAEAYQDVSTRMTKMKSFDKEHPAHTEVDLDKRIAEFKEIRNELSHIQEVSGPHISEATAKLKELDQSLGRMYLARNALLEQAMQGSKATVFEEIEPKQHTKNLEQAKALEAKVKYITEVVQGLKCEKDDDKKLQKDMLVMCKAVTEYNCSKSLGDLFELMQSEKEDNDTLGFSACKNRYTTTISTQQKLEGAVNGNIAKTADLLWRKGKHPEDLEVANMGLQVNPKDPTLHLIKSVSLNSLGRFDEAEAAYQASVKHGAPAEMLEAATKHMMDCLDKRMQSGEFDGAKTKLKQHIATVKSRVQDLRSKDLEGDMEPLAKASAHKQPQTANTQGKETSINKADSMRESMGGTVAPVKAQKVEGLALDDSDKRLKDSTAKIKKYVETARKFFIRSNSSHSIVTGLNNKPRGDKSPDF